MKKIHLTILATVFFAAPVFAQEGTAVNADDMLKDMPPKVEAEVESVAEATKPLNPLMQSVADAKAENEDKDVLAQKIEKAKAMHNLRPTRVQVDGAVRQVALSLPETDRQNFTNAMRTMLNYNAIERISMDSMVDTYTLVELSAMVEYYSKPEAKSASQKIGLWAQAVQPEIGRMIDKAMMRVRTGQ